MRKAGSTMEIQRGLKKDSVHSKFVLGAHPIIEQFIETMRIREIISTYMASDKRMKLDDDKVLTLLIHNILTTPNPLYEMEDWLRPLDVERLGLSPQEACHIHDDKIGKGLYRFYLARHKDVFFRLALRIIKVFELDCSRIHQDTTTVTFAGKYPGWSIKELLTHGKNKDHRPDLKQLVLGLSVIAPQPDASDSDGDPPVRVVLLADMGDQVEQTRQLIRNPFRLTLHLTRKSKKLFCKTPNHMIIFRDPFQCIFNVFQAWCAVTLQIAKNTLDKINLSV